MSISSEEAATIRTEHQFLKEQFGQVLEALKENTDTASKILRKMDKHDLREEYRQQEIDSLKDSINDIAEKIGSHIEKTEPAIAYAETKRRRSEKFWDSIATNWGKFALGFVVIATLAYLKMSLGLDLTDIKVG